MAATQFIQPGFEQALAHAIEEAGAFLAAAGKTQRFGPWSVNPLVDPAEHETNADWMARELADLAGALTRLAAELETLGARTDRMGAHRDPVARLQKARFKIDQELRILLGARA